MLLYVEIYTEISAQHFHWRRRVLTPRDFHSVHGFGVFASTCSKSIELSKTFPTETIAREGLTDLREHFSQACATQRVN